MGLIDRCFTGKALPSLTYSQGCLIDVVLLSKLRNVVGASGLLQLRVSLEIEICHNSTSWSLLLEASSILSVRSLHAGVMMPVLSRCQLFHHLRASSVKSSSDLTCCLDYSKVGDGVVHVWLLVIVLLSIVIVVEGMRWLQSTVVKTRGVAIINSV